MTNHITKAKIPFIKLFYLASKHDIILIIGGTISAIINGMMQPLFGQLFGEMSQKFRPENSPSEVFDGSIVIGGYFILVGAISFILSCCMLYCWISAGERQTIKIREAFYKSLIKQDISYFDSINANELSTKVTSDCYKIQQALGEKLCMNLYTFSMLVGSLFIAFIRGWQIALISCIIIPIVWYTCIFLTWVSNGVVRKTTQAYQEAGGIAEQALSSIRTVKSLNGEEFESEKYNTLMQKAFKVSLKYSLFTGVAYGIQNMMLFFDFSLTFWVGSLLIENEVVNQNMDRDYLFSDIIVVFLSIVLTSFRLGGATDSIKYFEEAQIAGFDLFQILDRQPIIHQNEEGLCAQQSMTNYQINFENVSFSYPNRPEIDIFSNISFQLQPKKKTAIVGKSGSGKSTIIQLLERFYNPTSGRILIDGIELQKFQLNSLRQTIGYVSQEPVLFGTTIRENLRFAKPDATEEEMIDSLKKANVWTFIQNQEKKLDTFVGQNGTQLSGGQKQRICIARAILKQPKILLLDEATSALDTKNEIEIQKTLDEVAQGITTIIVAHRLSTIQNADEIIVIDQGQIMERGTHQNLISKNGFYSEFVKKQQEIDLKNEQNKELQNVSCPKERSQEELNTMINLDRQISTQSTNLFTVQNLNTCNQLGLLENDLQRQQSTKQFVTLPTENLITDIKTEGCDLVDQNEYVYQNQKQTQQKTKKQKKNKKQYSLGSMLGKLLSYNKNQMINAFLGIFFSIGNGIAYPLCGWVFGNIASILLNPNTQNFREKCNEYSMYFALIGIMDLISLSLQYFFQSKIAENLTFSLRCDLFKKYLKMPISWFDKPKNHSAALCQSLSQDCKNVNVLIGTTLTFNVANISSLLCAILLGLIADWRTTLVGLALLPLIILSSIFYCIKLNMFNSKMNQSSEDTIKLINEASCFIKTLSSFGNPQCFHQNFTNILNQNIIHIKKSAFQTGIAIGLYNLSLFGVYGIIFISGASFHKNNGVEIRDILISILCLMFAALGIGKNTEFMGNAGTSLVSANKIFNQLSKNDEQQLENGKFSLNQVNGEIIFDNVSFKYPQRDTFVLKNVSFTIPARSKVAFVGPSGSGKSSLIQLIQKFYTAFSGSIYLDGVNLKQFNINKYRNYFGVVQQEPVLFNGTIKENITYNSKNITEEDITQASQVANVQQIINIFSEGYEKQVGIRGTQISGGQKQRVAISRMILKKPQIMLFDEATSALDSQNEQVVKEQLNKQMSGHTSISIAHRISTIKDSDIIFVLNNGQIVEQGNYQSLIENKNYYYNLIQNSNNDITY